MKRQLTFQQEVERSGIVRRTLIVFIVAQVALATASRPGIAQEDVEELARRGAELFQEGDFRQAARVLLQAYQTEPVSVLLYNIARAYQQDGRCFTASQFFNDYLNSGDTQALTQAQQHEPGETECANEYSRLMSQADDALNSGQLGQARSLIGQALEMSDEPNARIMYAQTLYHLGQCEESRDFILGIQDDGDFSDAQVGELGSDLGRAEECVSDRLCSDQRSQCEEDNQTLLAESQGSQKTLRLVSYIVGGVGVATLIGAIIHDVVSQNTIDDYEEAALRGDEEAFQDGRDAVDSAKTVSIILYSVGIVGIATGVTLWFLSRGEEPDLRDCGAVCWDFGVGTPSGDPGAWVSGTW